MSISQIVQFRDEYEPIVDRISSEFNADISLVVDFKIDNMVVVVRRPEDCHENISLPTFKSIVVKFVNSGAVAQRNDGRYISVDKLIVSRNDIYAIKNDDDIEVYVDFKVKQLTIETYIGKSRFEYVINSGIIASGQHVGYFSKTIIPEIRFERNRRHKAGQNI